MNYTGLGKRIKAARRAQNLTQEELANRVGISLSFLGHIERGTRKASMETLVKLANVLGESLDQLLRDSLLLIKETRPQPSPMQVLHTLRSPEPDNRPRTRSALFGPSREEADLINALKEYLDIPSGESNDAFSDWDD